VVVSATSINLNYLSYVPLFSKSLQTFTDAELVLGIISHRNQFENLVYQLNDYVRTVVIEPDLGVDPGVQAKYSRLVLACDPEFTDRRVSIADLDLVQLNDRRWSALADFSGDCVIKWGYDHPSYYEEANLGKWPMDGTTALGKVFQRIVNPDHLSRPALLESWAILRGDGRENPYLPFGVFSDESLLRTLFATSSLSSNGVSRKAIDRAPMSGRLDKSQTIRPFTRSRLRSGFYSEMHGFRPFNSSANYGLAVLSHLGISRREYISFLSDLRHNLGSGI
jgi:hypothetical protein